ncbi:MAG: radical SAM protein [Deltaproteobacteria bacterium]|nr:radical SAM protein [Deltaproteobacteria bacterium]
MQESDAILPGGGSEADKIAEKESAAHEKRQWVRLTSYCNNRCTFCLDSAAHNGTFVSRREVRRQIMDGRSQGATRLILSGGEPTIHPNFVEFVKLGRQLGYTKVQTVTNGRLFSYPKFLAACLDAGLSEITFSVHGHTAKVHDALVGVQGAYEEELEGLVAALSDGRPIVNVDVCLNRGNIKGLPTLLDEMMEKGVREFDLLHIIPFGRAFDEGKTGLFYDIDEAMPSIQYALELSKRPDVHIWFNRFPPPYLEGHEELIQDPYKLGDEVRGRREEYDRWIDQGIPISCRAPERCSRCYLVQLCGSLEAHLASRQADDFEVLQVQVAADGAFSPPGESKAAELWIRAADLGSARKAARGLPGERLTLELESFAGLAEALAPDGTLDGRPLRAAYVASAGELDALLALPGEFEVGAILGAELAAHLMERWPEPPARLVLAARGRERLTTEKEQGADLKAFFEAYAPDTKVPVEGVPACLVGDPERIRPRRRTLTTASLDGAGRTDIFAFTGQYILDDYLTKSHRCSECRLNDECPGAHINYVRARGYSQLQPLK